MEFKVHSFDLKEIDEDKGIIGAYANVYNNKDSDGDISANGSFDKTVKDNFKRIRVLKNHDSRIMLGVPLDINTQDTFGLLTTTKFNMQKEVSRDMFTDIKLMHEEGLSAELSIGYSVLQRDKKNKDIITEYKLMEYSFLTSWAANELATVQNIKGIKSFHGIMELIEKSYNLDYSDRRLKQIETILKALTKEPDNTTPEVEPLSILQEFNKQFND